jgi:hypothetical protein
MGRTATSRSAGAIEGAQVQAPRPRYVRRHDGSRGRRRLPHMLARGRRDADAHRDCRIRSSRSLATFAAIGGDHLRRDQQLGGASRHFGSRMASWWTRSGGSRASKRPLFSFGARRKWTLPWSGSCCTWDFRGRGTDSGWSASRSGLRRSSKAYSGGAPSAGCLLLAGRDRARLGNPVRRHVPRQRRAGPDRRPDLGCRAARRRRLRAGRRAGRAPPGRPAGPWAAYLQSNRDRRQKRGG